VTLKKSYFLREMEVNNEKNRCQNDLVDILECKTELATYSLSISKVIVTTDLSIAKVQQGCFPTWKSTREC
jgi:hypothetical protein